MSRPLSSRLKAGLAGLALALGVVGGAAAVAPDSAASEVLAAPRTPGSVTLNSVTLNSVTLNSVTLNSVTLNSVTLNSGSSNSVTLN